jgi:peptidoglycan lytic transglycosylase
MPIMCRASAASGPNIVRCVAVVLAAAALAACAQSKVASGRSDFFGASRYASVQHHQHTRVATTERVSIVRRHDPYASEKHTGDLKLPSQGVASFYTEGARTANGEKFDPNQLTAAHPTLPFGTKLRVTNTTNGQSVTVRVNDRGPFVPGRVVDVSYSAAQALGMVGQGTAKVKLDVMQ